MEKLNNQSGGLLVLKGEEVRALLSGRERQVLEITRSAYAAHREGRSSLPHSLFLRFPGEQKSRIIALPAYLSLGEGIAGLKWVSSFPQNLEQGLDRASAVVILNSPRTGHPEALLEGSVISAKRTAASAALAAKHLHEGKRVDRVGVVGCGLINFETVRYLSAVFTGLESLVVFDVDASRARQFARKCQSLWGLEAEVAEEVKAVLGGASLVSLATTAVEPHIFDLSPCPAGSTLLHVSLRDLSPEAILACDNVVDDIDHVCRAETSVHLAERMLGHRGFIRCTLADIMGGAAAARRDDEGVAVFSPFGLGILDIALAKFVADFARERGAGTFINSFLPAPWAEQES